jgi:hypothetical protein
MDLNSIQFFSSPAAVAFELLTPSGRSIACGDLALAALSIPGSARSGAKSASF